MDISYIFVFENIKEETKNLIIEKSEVINLKKNTSLYTDRVELNYVYFVVRGKVTLLKSNENGESKIIFILGRGDMINQPIMRKNTSAVECWGFENCEILRIKFDDFDYIMSQDYTLARNCMVYMEKRIRRLYRQLKNTVSSSLEKKLAAKLYKLGLDYGKDCSVNMSDGSGSFESLEEMTLININLTITYLAKMLGSQRESVSRAMKSLSEKDIVYIDGKKIYIDMESAREFFKS